MFCSILERRKDCCPLSLLIHSSTSSSHQLIMCFKLPYMLRTLAYLVTITAASSSLLKPVLSPLSGDLKQREGSRLMLTCAATYGQTPILFAWKKDGREVQGSTKEYQVTVDELSSMLLVKNVSRIHAGSYSCTASNAHGTDSQSSLLTVQCLKFFFFDLNLEYQSN